MTTPQTTAAAGSTAATKKKPASSSIFSLKCGCKDTKSVSISNSLSDGSHGTADYAATSQSGNHHPRALSARPETSSADTITLTTPTTSTSHREEEEDDSPSFSGLLRQLSELERRVVSWDHRQQTGESETEEEGDNEKARHRVDGAVGGAGAAKSGGSGSNSSPRRLQRHQGNGRHRRCQSDGGGGRVLGKVGESVAVVKQTEDPLGDFRRSMLQMIVEQEILSGEELRDLLCRFLALNSPSHHALIIRAFADIWRDVFSGYGGDDSADLLPPVHRLQLPHRPRPQLGSRQRCHH